MPQYYLVRESDLEALPWALEAERMGFLDFLRALQQDPPALAPERDLRLEGIEDVLVASRPEVEAVTYQLRRILQHAAGTLNRLCINVAVVVRNPILPGAQLWVKHPAAKLPIYLVFGSPTAVEANGRSVYPVSYNLSSGF